jgi:hypothetical protein
VDLLQREQGPSFVKLGHPKSDLTTCLGLREIRHVSVDYPSHFCSCLSLQELRDVFNKQLWVCTLALPRAISPA